MWLEVNQRYYGRVTSWINTLRVGLEFENDLVWCAPKCLSILVVKNNKGEVLNATIHF